MNQSIPFSYLTIQVSVNDGNPHKVELYTDVTGEWLISGSAQPQSDQLFQWETIAGDAVNHRFWLQNQTQFLEVNGRARYGNVMYSTKQVGVPSCVT